MAQLSKRLSSSQHAELTTWREVIPRQGGGGGLFLSDSEEHPAAYVFPEKHCPDHSLWCRWPLQLQGDHLRSAHPFSFSLWTNLRSESLELGRLPKGYSWNIRAKRRESSNDNSNSGINTLIVHSLSPQSLPASLRLGALFCFVRMTELQPRSSSPKSHLGEGGTEN